MDQADDIQDYDGLSSHSFRALVCWRYASRCCRRHSQCRAHLTVEPSSSLPLPAVLTAPIRLDVVRQVHSKFKLSSWTKNGTHMLQRALLRTGGRHTPWVRRPVTKLLPSLGVLVALLPVFPVLVVEEPIVRVRYVHLHFISLTWKLIVRNIGRFR